MINRRSFKIVRLMSWAVSTYLRGNKLQFVQGSAKLEELGGLYIKFLQLIVLNLDPDNQRNYQEMLEVYEHSPADKLNIWTYLRRELTDQQLSQFKTIADQPFATGSFGQVYRAELNDGQTVIIKILRPSVQKYLYSDLRLLTLLSWVYSLVDRQNLLDFKLILKRFKQTSLEETNYTNEAAVAEYYYQTYKNHQYLTIPKTYGLLSNHNVIVQEYIEGISLTSLLAMQTSGQDAKAYVASELYSDLHWQLEVVGTELLSQAVLGNIMHADPHPGNIILLPNHRVALIDFGMSTVLTKNRFAFYQMLVQYVAFYTGKLAIDELALSAFKFLQRDLFEVISQAESSLSSNHRSDQPIMNKIRSAVAETFYDEANRPVVTQLLERRAIMRILFFTINRGNRFGFSFDLEAINLIKAAQNFSVLMMNFDKQGTIIAKMLQNVVNVAEANLELVVDSKEATARPDPETALEIISCWIDKMSRSDPWLVGELASEYVK